MIDKNLWDLIRRYINVAQCVGIIGLVPSWSRLLGHCNGLGDEESSIIVLPVGYGFQGHFVVAIAIGMHCLADVIGNAEIRPADLQLHEGLGKFFPCPFILHLGDEGFCFVLIVVIRNPAPITILVIFEFAYCKGFLCFCPRLFCQLAFGIVSIKHSEGKFRGAISRELIIFFRCDPAFPAIAILCNAEDRSPGMVIHGGIHYCLGPGRSNHLALRCGHCLWHMRNQQWSRYMWPGCWLRTCPGRRLQSHWILPHLRSHHRHGKIVRQWQKTTKWPQAHNCCLSQQGTGFEKLSLDFP